MRISTLYKWAPGILLIVLLGCEPAVTEDPTLLAQLPEVVDFNHHIRPLFSDRCFTCHGPDENTREADFRLDTEEGAYGRIKESDRNYALVEGSLRRSEVAHRIASDDPDYMMPPPESNLALSDYEVALIRKWIDQGAEWKQHWAFIAPTKPAVPSLHDTEWPVNDIDRFVLSRLEKRG